MQKPIIWFAFDDIDYLCERFASPSQVNYSQNQVVMKTKRILIAALLLIGTLPVSVAQTYSPNVITTAVPFLSNSPDARGASLGFSGVATSPDAFSMFYNPAKYAFMNNDHTMIASGFNAFSSVIPDQYTLFDAFAQKIGRSAIAATARYHRSGEVMFVDEIGEVMGYFSPQEFAIDMAYSRRFGDYLSAGLAGRFIYSSMRTPMVGYTSKAYSIAGDISIYYQRPLGNLIDMSLGAAITNIGTKMTYVAFENQKDFIPTTLRLGSGFKFNFHPKNTLSVNVEFSKLLVPTPPICDFNDSILYGYDDNVSVFRGMIQSFYDAPGYAMNYATGDFEHVGSFYEELCEVNTGIGIEYNLADHFFVRTGYYHVPDLKGGVDCLTESLGMKFGIFGMDLSCSYYIRKDGVISNGQSMNGRLRWDMYFAF